MDSINKVIPLINDENNEDIENSAMPDNQCSRSSHRLSSFMRKYFWEGQKLNNDFTATFEDYHPIINNVKCVELTIVGKEHGVNRQKWDGWDVKRFVNGYPKLFGLLIPFGFMQLAWWTLAIRYNLLARYPTHYAMPLTMIFGATVAGMTSEGGGAVAFPVMTFLLNLDTKDARDFSLMIQSCGMTSAAFTIIWMGVKIEWNAIVIGSLGSTFGIIFGLTYIDEIFTGSEKKMLFVAIWSSFALALFLLNSMKRRVTFENVHRLNGWKSALLFLVGFIGGICSAFAGSGVDICTFSILTLLFRVSEKIATPTSVVMMAVNTCVGFFWRHLIQCNVSQLAWEYFSVSVPVVVLCAPLGSLIASHFHRLVLASFVYVLETAAIIGFLLTGPELKHLWIGAIIIVVSFVFFNVLSKLGGWLHSNFDAPTPSFKGRNRLICPRITKETLSTFGLVVGPR